MGILDYLLIGAMLLIPVGLIYAGKQVYDTCKIVKEIDKIVNKGKK